MILDHIGFNVSNFAATKEFLVKALGPLGIGVVSEGQGWVMVPGPIHIAFAAENRAQVQAFHAAALAAGGKDNGPPGIRAQYHPNYYGAFVIGPDGHNFEAACHRSEA